MVGNLSLTINAFQNLIEQDSEVVSQLMFVTTNGIFFGDPTFTKDPSLFTETDSLAEVGYSIANFLPDEETKDDNDDDDDLSDFDFRETILLKNVKCKVGKTIIGMDSTVINVNQIVSIQIVYKDKIDEMMKGF